MESAEFASQKHPLPTQYVILARVTTGATVLRERLLRRLRLGVEQPAQALAHVEPEERRIVRSMPV